jgi:GH18 family chitinase
LPEWRYGSFNFEETFKTLSHLLFFSVEPTSDGALTGLDRLPSAEALAAAHAARAAHGTKLLLCVGGNGRSSGFGPAARRRTARKRLVQNIVDLVLKLDLDGWDCNWEYPGFTFGGGYASDGEVAVEWDALASLLRESRIALDAALKLRGRPAVVTAAYYPDGRQEGLLAARRVTDSVELLHAMAYDAPGAGGHSPLSLAQNVITRAQAARLPLRSIALGVPMYGRNTVTGDWTTYEELVRDHWPLPPDTDSVAAAGGPPGSRISFNGESLTGVGRLIACVGS